MLGIRKQVLNGTPPHNVICLHLAKYTSPGGSGSASLRTVANLNATA
jgi:hypothetical protein